MRIIFLIMLLFTMVFIPKAQGLPISNDNGSGMMFDGNMNSTNTTANTTANTTTNTTANTTKITMTTNIVKNTMANTTTTTVSVKEVSQTLFCSGRSYMDVSSNATISNSPYNYGRMDICKFGIAAKPNRTTLITILYKKLGAMVSDSPQNCRSDFILDGRDVTYVNPEDREGIKACYSVDVPIYILTNNTLFIRYINDNDHRFKDAGFLLNVSYIPYGYIIQKRHTQPLVVNFFTTKTITLFIVLGLLFSILTILRLGIFRYTQKHKTPYFKINTRNLCDPNLDYSNKGKCCAIFIIHTGGILVDIIYCLMYKILPGVITKCKSLYNLLKARINCWRTTFSNINTEQEQEMTNVNVIIGDYKIACSVCLCEKFMLYRDLNAVKQVDIKNLCLVYGGELDNFDINTPKFTTEIVFECNHSLCFICALTILTNQAQRTPSHPLCPLCRSPITLADVCKYLRKKYIK